MDYRVDRTRIRGGSRLPIVLATVFVVGLFGLALSTADRPAGIAQDRGSVGVTPVAVAGATDPGSSVGVGPAASPNETRAPIPAGIVRCRELAAADCLRIARSAVSVVDSAAPPRTDLRAVAGVDVRGSLICDDDNDCPRNRLATLNLLGSAAVHLADPAATAWVNVGETIAAPNGAARGSIEAWVIRWYP